MSSANPSRSGLSFIEVSISIAILVTALAALVGNLFTLNQSHRVNQEVARVRDIVQLVVERIQGANWSDIGSQNLSWTWLRRGPLASQQQLIDPDDPATVNQVVAGVNPPMTESAIDRDHNLIISEPANPSLPVTGLLREPSGIQDLRVWVEYRSLSALQDVVSRPTWMDKLQDANLIIDPMANPTLRDPAALPFNPATFTDALVVRVVARWSSVAGGERHYEVSFARRR